MLGHALYMRAIHGGKAKNDKIDSQKIALLLTGGLIPQAYAYLAERRATRDLLRRRMHLARERPRMPVQDGIDAKLMMYTTNDGVTDHACIDLRFHRL